MNYYEQKEFGEFLKGVLAGIFLMGAFALTWPKDACADTYAVATVASHHFQHPNTHNELNLGLGFETDVTHNVRAIGGFYKNSNYRETVYGGAAYLPFQIGNLKFGGAAAVATGYSHSPSLGAFAVAAYERDGWGANLGIVPPVGKSHAILGVQFKLKFQ